MVEDFHDPPMPLGAHLEELRWRLIKVLLCFGAFFIAGFTQETRLKALVVLPLRWAIRIVGPEVAANCGLPADGSGRILSNFSLQEGPIASMVLVSYVALLFTVPVLLFQVWRFVRPALRRSETKLAFVFLPLAVILFYLGAVLGFFVGIPYMFAFLIRWNAQDLTTDFVPNQRMYLGLFAMMTISFGLLLNIPWLIMVLVRVGLVTPQWLGRQRRMVIMVAIILAAVLTPPDPYSQIAFFIPIMLLFEIGLLLSRFWVRPEPAAGDVPEAPPFDPVVGGGTAVEPRDAAVANGCPTASAVPADAPLTADGEPMDAEDPVTEDGGPLSTDAVADPGADTAQE